MGLSLEWDQSPTGNANGNGWDLGSSLRSSASYLGAGTEPEKVWSRLLPMCVRFSGGWLRGNLPGPIWALELAVGATLEHQVVSSA